MKPNSLKAAAVELLTEIYQTVRPASEVINTYTRNRRYIGSKDRRNLTETVWNYIRHNRRLAYAYPDLNIEKRLDKLPDLPEVIRDAPSAVNYEVPDWLIAEIPNSDKELPALLDTADTVLRANGNRDAIQKMLSETDIETEKTTLSPYGLKLKKRINLNAHPLYKQGLIEIQDEGSQCVALETGIQAGDTVLDYCAGAGGKSLIFAQMMQDKGKIIASDISDRSLAELQKRAERANVHCIRVQKPLKPALYDHVVVDAPCSGTGTWRRCPDARFKLTQEQLNKIVKVQSEILDTVVPFVKQQGKLSYMTCSLTEVENSGQVQAFLNRHPDFKCIKKKQYSPYQTKTDGLFIAVFERK